MSLGLIIITLLAYSAILLAVSYATSRRAGASTFFVGDRNQSVVVVTLGMISAAMSGVTFISVPGMVINQGFTYMQMALGFVVGQIIIATVLVPLYYRLGVTSIYEYLSERFGPKSRYCGSALFFVGKIVGTAIRLMLVCAVLHTITDRIPFELLVVITTTIAWGYTRRGGVKSVIWSDLLKSIILIGSVIAIGILLLHDTDTALLADNLRHTSIIDTNPYSPTFLPKSFVAGVVVVVAMTGLDQDMMQRTLSCRSRREAQLNVMISGVLQVVVIALFLLLGVVMHTFVEGSGMALPESGDTLFPLVATMPNIPKVVGVLFILGLAASSFSSIGSAMTALTTSFTLDILRQPQGRSRHLTHAIVTITVGALAIALYHWNNQSAIDLTFRLAAYTYGPILGLFTFGLCTKRTPDPRFIPIVALLSPALTLVIAHFTPIIFDNFHFGHEILIINAAIMFVGLLAFSGEKHKFARRKK